MGLLDDAIREHLDLKRRRGADPAEVERLEREALGPVRRNRDLGEAVMPEDELAPHGGFAYDQEEEPHWSHEPQDVDAFPEAESGYADEDLLDDRGFAADQPPPPPAPERQRMRPDLLHDATADDPAAPVDWEEEPGEAIAPQPFPTTSGSSRRRVEDDAGPETTEYHVDEPRGPHQDEPDEDMLEETPEFLQDTPDHDRLWFEQRPPRDFDFDG